MPKYRYLPGYVELNRGLMIKSDEFGFARNIWQIT